MAFRSDNTLIKFLSLISDAMIVGLLWLLTSLLVVTIGASTTAAYYVLLRRISDRESSIVSDYFKSFKENFKNSTIIFIVISLFSLLNLYNMLYNQVSGIFGLIIYGLQIILGIELIFVYIHFFPLAARFDLRLKQLVRTAIILANKHLFITLTHGALLVAIVWFSLNAPFVIVFSVGFYCWLSSYMLIKVYRKYKPDMDKDMTTEAEESK